MDINDRNKTHEAILIGGPKDRVWVHMQLFRYTIEFCLPPELPVKIPEETEPTFEKIPTVVYRFLCETKQGVLVYIMEGLTNER